ncbi:MAG: DUF4115 domain-containing protein [Anaerolineales bacterium]|nr:DUF4115 domain-containing protein [Anaerolineales bacterium]
MTGIGEQLRAARAARGCSLEEAERQTRIRARLLAALEAEDFSAFASATQARGFLRNYAEFLGLEAEAVLAGLSAGAAKARPTARPAAARPAAAPPSAVVGGGWRRFFTWDLFIGVTVTALFTLLLVWGGWQLWQALGAAPAPTVTPAGVSAAGTPAAGTAAPSGPTPTATPPEATPTEPLPTPRPNYVGVNVLVRAEQRVWLRAVVDGAETFAGQLTPGEAREFVGNTAVELWTGNGLGTRVVFNGQDQGVLGGLGEVVIRIWTLAGVVTPTPTATATP